MALWRVLPAVYEARYLTMMRELQAASTAGAEVKFGHILAPTSAPPALMHDSIAGYPRIGVCAAVKSFQELPNGRLQVNYQGLRRFQVLAVDDDAHPYPVAAAAWLDDEQSQTHEQSCLTEQLELDVFSLLQQVAKYSKLLEDAASEVTQRKQLQFSSAETAAEGHTDVSSSQKLVLPDAVLMYAPPPPRKQSMADYMKRAGMPAGDRIATWQRMGSVYGDTAAKKRPSQDIYQLLRDQLGKERRQELFSFAAASLLDLGMPERLALLQCKDTAARLQFVAVAVQPYLQDLVARVSVKQAITP
eukprot:gene5370-5605_t